MCPRHSRRLHCSKPKHDAQVPFVCRTSIDKRRQAISQDFLGLGSDPRDQPAGRHDVVNEAGILAVDQAYLDAIVREMSKEYRAVVDAGFVLQIDAPDLAMERVPCRRAEQGARGHPAGPRAAACVLG